MGEKEGKDTLFIHGFFFNVVSRFLLNGRDFSTVSALHGKKAPPKLLACTFPNYIKVMNGRPPASLARNITNISGKKVQEVVRLSQDRECWRQLVRTSCAAVNTVPDVTNR